jgi:hypothetical protein
MPKISRPAPQAFAGPVVTPAELGQTILYLRNLAAALVEVTTPGTTARQFALCLCGLVGAMLRDAADEHSREVASLGGVMKDWVAARPSRSVAGLTVGEVAKSGCRLRTFDQGRN